MQINAARPIFVKYYLRILYINGFFGKARVRGNSSRLLGFFFYIFHSSRSHFDNNLAVINYREALFCLSAFHLPCHMRQ